ncbi:MAG: ribonucleoside-triphosphate reductase [Epsilonproteobacteria bacterium]|nr:ribonucleoside-triphosphate reductase [Campylobacterota bacterium]
MYFKVSFDSDFDTLMMHLWSKYGRELFDIDGIGKQCDMNWFAKNFFNSGSTVADKSVDSNSNITEKDVNVYNHEFPKPFQRYNSYYLLWKELKKIYGLATSNRIIEDQLTGKYYINDFSGVGCYYCMNYSTYDIALAGLPMIKKIISEAPKHLYSFKSQIEQFTIIAANNSLGASGLADLLVVMSYYIDKILRTKSDAHFKFATEEDCWTYVKETLFSMVYTFNQPTRSSQSCFTNVSVYDDYFLKTLCDDYKFVEDGEIVTVKMDVAKKTQSIFLDVMNETLRRTPTTFPVTTACFVVDDNGEVLDKDFVNFIAEKNEEFAFINIYSGKSSTLSSCCFEGCQEIVLRDEVSNGQYRLSFKEAYNIFKDKKIGVLSNGTFKPGKIISVLNSGKFKITVVTKAGQILNMTHDHMCLVYGDVLGKNVTRADELRVGDLLICSYEMQKGTYFSYNYDFSKCKIINGEVCSEIETIQYSSFDPEDPYAYCFEMEDQEDPFFTLANGVHTHNCRLRSDSSNEYFNSFGAGSTKLGSLGVVSLNMPRLAYISESEDSFFDELRKAVIDVAYINNAKRNIIKKRIDLGAYSLYSLGFADIKRQYSTCGVNGLNECCNEFGYDILTEDGQAFVLRCLDVINKTNDEMQKRYKTPHNCEQVPAESSAIKLVTKDRYLGFNPKTEFYSNQFIPLTTNADMLDRIRLQGLFDKHFSGGAICHLNLGEKISKKTMADMIVSCAKMGVVYWAVNYQLNRCCDGHMSVGTTDVCPVCGKDVEDKYTRIVGFLTNVKNWHKTRRELDFPNRQFYRGIV